MLCLNLSLPFYYFYFYCLWVLVLYSPSPTFWIIWIFLGFRCTSQYVLCDKGVPLIFSFQVSMMLTFFSRGWDIAGGRGSPARRVSGWGVASPGGICSSHGFIPLWFCSLNLVKTFLQPSWPPNHSPRGGPCTAGLLPPQAAGLPTHTHITSC